MSKQFWSYDLGIWFLTFLKNPIMTGHEEMDGVSLVSVYRLKSRGKDFVGDLLMSPDEVFLKLEIIIQIHFAFAGGLPSIKKPTYLLMYLFFS